MLAADCKILGKLEKCKTVTRRRPELTDTHAGPEKKKAPHGEDLYHLLSK